MSEDIKEVKVKFTKNSKGEIIGVEINEEITESQLLEYFVKPEIERAKKEAKEDILKKIDKDWNDLFSSNWGLSGLDCPKIIIDDETYRAFKEAVLKDLTNLIKSDI